MADLAQLALRSAAGDEGAFAELAGEMKGAVRAAAARYYAPGLDAEDLRQAALVGLWKGCRTYDPAKAATADFAAFAGLCMKRNVITAVKTATRLKHAVLATSLSLDDAREGADGDASTLHDTLADRRQLEPHVELELRGDLDAIAATIRDDLSPLERDALLAFANGATYAEIRARRGNVSAKGVDNAIQRARAKMRRANETASPLGVAA